jgi:hypothetical protein
MLRDHRFDDLDNFLLLAAGELGHGGKHRAHLAARFDGPPWRRFAGKGSVRGIVIKF